MQTSWQETGEWESTFWKMLEESKCDDWSFQGHTIWSDLGVGTLLCSVVVFVVSWQCFRFWCLECCLLLPLRSLDIAWRCVAKSKPIYQHRFVDGVSSFTSSLCVKCPKKDRHASRSMGHGGRGIHRCCLWSADLIFLGESFQPQSWICWCFNIWHVLTRVNPVSSDHSI